MGLLVALKAYLVDFPFIIGYNLVQRVWYFFSPGSFKGWGEDALTDDWLASNRFLKTCWRLTKLEAAREVSLGSDAFDADLYDLQSGSTVKLFDFMKQDRPLVVNFGSCT